MHDRLRRSIIIKPLAEKQPEWACAVIKHSKYSTERIFCSLKKKNIEFFKTPLFRNVEKPSCIFNDRIFHYLPEYSNITFSVLCIAAQHITHYSRIIIYKKKYFFAELNDTIHIIRQCIPNAVENCPGNGTEIDCIEFTKCNTDGCNGATAVSTNTAILGYLVLLWTTAFTFIN